MSTDIVKFMDRINVILSFVEESLKREDISNLKIEDYGDSIAFILARGKHDVVCEKFEKIDDDSLKTIYDSLAEYYQGRIEIGATSTFAGSNVMWNLAPVIDDKLLIEFISGTEKNQKWFYEEMVNSTKQKGLK